MLPIEFLRPAENFFKKLRDKELKRKYYNAIQDIRNNPYIGQMKTGDLAGIYGFDISYKGINYEIAYRLSEVENGEIIVIIMAGTRENFWNAIKNYIK